MVSVTYKRKIADRSNSIYRLGFNSVPTKRDLVKMFLLEIFSLENSFLASLGGQKVEIFVQIW